MRRRTWLGRTWQGVALACALAGWQGLACAAVDLAPFLKREGFERVKISPDGRYYAATMPLEDREALVVLRREDKQAVTKIVGARNSAIGDFWWANDERVIVASAEHLGSRDQPYLTGQLYAVGVHGERVKSLFGAEPSPNQVSGDDGTPLQAGTFVGRIPDDPRSILVAVSGYDATPQTRVDKVNVYSGARMTVATAPVPRATFVTDARGSVRLAVGANNDNYSKLYYRDGLGADWRLVNDEAASGHLEWPLGFSADGATAYLQVEQAQGPDAVVAWDTRSGARRELLRDPVLDPYAIVRDVDGRTPVGVQYLGERLHTRFFDEDGTVARAYRTLEQALPGLGLEITSFTGDGRLALVTASNDRTPGDVYLYDTQAHTAHGVIAQREWLDPAQLPATREVTLQARDGLPLHGYLTVPRNAPAQPLPMVVVPHGGPFGVFDTPGFDDDSQLLAAAGYAVLRLNYRGSGNYGRAFLNAGARQWGGTMQDDLTDATRWAIAQKLADPQRICIYGGSYGGYAALMGAAREPALYRCAVGYVGVYDLTAFHRNVRNHARWSATWAEDWIGGRDTLAARSPTTLAGQIRVPVLLVAGGQDERAPIAHSRKMEQALREAQVPVETLYVQSEGHGFYTEAHRREFYRRLLDFLARSLGGERAAEAAVAASD